jgi:WD40 repeat protein
MGALKTKPAVKSNEGREGVLGIIVFGCAVLLAAMANYGHAAVAEAWVRSYNGPGNGEDGANAMAVDKSGNVFVTGFSAGAGSGFDYYTAKYSGLDGSLLWERRYNGPSNLNDYARSLALDSNGDVFVTGSSQSGIRLTSAPEILDYLTLKYSSVDGALLWEQRYVLEEGPSTEFATSVVVDTNDDVIVTGSSGTLKYAGVDGALLWAKHENRGSLAAVDANNDVIVTGFYGTFKCASADGAVLWLREAGGQCVALAVDHGGNVVVAGRFNPSSWTDDFYTAKFAGTNGALIWKQAITLGAASALALDANDDVIVTGYTNNSPTFLHTAKFSGTSGALLWQRATNTSSSFLDAGHAVAVDGRGDVYIGASVKNAANQDYYTAKYAGTNGTLLWDQRYNGTLNAWDRACTNCLALGPDGLIVIAGASDDWANFGTVAYRETLSAVSVERIPLGLRLRFPAVAAHSYQVLRAPALTGPWITNATLTAITNGPLEYLDTNAPPGSAFYRTSTGP